MAIPLFFFDKVGKYLNNYNGYDISDEFLLLWLAILVQQDPSYPWCAREWCPIWTRKCSGGQLLHDYVERLPGSNLETSNAVEHCILMISLFRLNMLQTDAT